MIVLETACLIIMMFYLIMRLHGVPNKTNILLRFAAVATAAWIAEDSAIRLYGFYQYSPHWSVFVDQVPLMVMLIWPIVVDSAIVMAGGGTEKHRALTTVLVGALVLSDASLIEPVAVFSGLWSWNAPGLFGVPPIGVFGWAFFAFAVTGIVRRLATNDHMKLLLIPLLAPLATHALLLAAWWSSLRWVSVPLNIGWAAALLWSLSLVVTVSVVRRRPGDRVQPQILAARVPAALFFFGLLALRGGEADLWTWVLAFVPPYLALSSQTFSRFLPGGRTGGQVA